MRRGAGLGPAGRDLRDKLQLAQPGEDSRCVRRRRGSVHGRLRSHEGPGIQVLNRGPVLRVVPPLVQKGRGAVSGSARGVPSTSRRRPGRSRGALRRVCAAGPVRRDCRRSRMGTLAPRAHCADGVGCGRCRWLPDSPVHAGGWPSPRDAVAPSSEASGGREGARWEVPHVLGRTVCEWAGLARPAGAHGSPPSRVPGCVRSGGKGRAARPREGTGDPAQGGHVRTILPSTGIRAFCCRR